MSKVILSCWMKNGERVSAIVDHETASELESLILSGKEWVELRDGCNIRSSEVSHMSIRPDNTSQMIEEANIRLEGLRKTWGI